MPQCRLCGHPTRPAVQQRVLAKYDVAYHRCGACDLIQSEPPYWLDEAYGGGAMSSFDTGAIARNALCAQITSVIARLLGLTARSHCADFGGGHGVFVRMMRDRGMDFRLCDKYADNIFARGFEAAADSPFELLTAFEVFEHFADPAAELSRLFAPGHDHLLISTVLHRDPPPNWWYFAPDSGQHVALYSRSTMRHIAARFGYQVMCGPALTLFIRSPMAISPIRRRMLSHVLRHTRPNRNARLAIAIDAIAAPFPSRTTSDNRELTGRSAA